MTTALWVDDCKPCPDGFAVARTYDDALKLLRRFSYETLYLDYDLGDMRGRTGYDLLVQALAEGIAPTEVRPISWNPTGRELIMSALATRTTRPAEGQEEG